MFGVLMPYSCSVFVQVVMRCGDWLESEPIVGEGNIKKKQGNDGEMRNLLKIGTLSVKIYP